MCLCTIVHVTQHLPTVEVFRFTTVFPGGIFGARCCIRTSVTLRARTISNFYSCLNKLYDMYNTYAKHVVYLHRRICMPNLFYLL